VDLEISKKSLFTGIARTHAVADRKSSMPILSNVLLAADEDGALRFAATDLYLAVNASAEAKVKRGGSVAISARTLFDIVKNLPEGEVKLSVDKNHAVQLRSGKIKFRIPGMPGEDFPPLPSPGEAAFAELEAGTLGQLIGLTQYSMSSDDTRPNLAGTLFEGDGKVVRMVTTDGHRLSKAESPSPGIPTFTMLVPQKGILELRRLIDKQQGSIGVASVGGSAFFRRPDATLSVKLADEQFPPWRKVVPSSHIHRVVAARELLVDATRRVALVASDKGGGVRLILEPGKIEIVSENPDVGEGSEEIDVDFAGEKVVMGANARYMLDALSALPDDEVVLKLNSELEPIVVSPLHDDRFEAVIMPQRI